ncbi:MAG TPA: BatD family protein, partial [Nitrospiria bacterium]|nr:BatD family protein [Nitrospiria bacterium]
DPLSTEILALPVENRPDGFMGAIGSFESVADLETRELKVGEPVTLTIAFSGEGNFERISPPELPEWKDWRVYPPKVEFSPEDDLGFKGQKSFEFILIPQSTDITEVPGLELVSFDPDSGEYRTTAVEPVPVTVEQSDLPLTEGPFLPQPGSEGIQVQRTPDKILPLKPGSGRLTPMGVARWQRTSYWIINGLVGLALLLAFLWQLRIKRFRTDVRLARRQAGGRKIRKALQSAQTAAKAGDAGKFLQSSRAALQECICHLSNRPVEAKTLVTSDCLNILKSKNVPAHIMTKVENLLHLADAHQFAGASPESESLSALIKDLSSALSELNRARD